MAYEFKEGQGSLFKNEKQNDRQPEYKGTILLGGVTYEIAAWERISQKRAPYFSWPLRIRNYRRHWRMIVEDAVQRR